MKPASLLLLVAVLATSAAAQIPPAAGGEPAHRVFIASASPADLRGALDTQGYDVSCFPLGPAHVEAVVSLAEHATLSAAGFSLSVQEVAQPLLQKLTQNLDLPPGYHDLAAINGILNTTQATYPSIAQVVNLNATFGTPTTVEGRSIYALKISDNVATDEDEPNVLIACCHHCREITTPELALDHIGRLCTAYGSDPQVTALVNANEIWFIPVQNPDGLEYTWTTNNLWRKNRRNNGNGTFGVDLNRNYPLGWAGGCPGSTTTSSETYKGIAPASEIETQTMMAFSRARRFAKVMDHHTYGREVLLGYLCSAFPAALDAQINAEGVALSVTAGYGTRDASAEGEHQQWQIQETTSYAFLTESELTFQPPYANAGAEAAILWPETLAFLNRAIPVQGHVTSALSGLPLAADIAIAGITFSNGETRKSRGLNGRYSHWLPAGTHQLVFSAPGYLPQTVPVTVSASGSTTLDVALQPAPPAFTLEFSSSGGGAGNLHLALLNIPAAANEGFTLFSFATNHPLGVGNLLGIQADIVTLQCLTSPSLAGNLLHFPLPAAPGLYPAVALDLPNGSVLLAPNTAVDAIGVGLTPAFLLAGATPPVRATF